MKIKVDKYTLCSDKLGNFHILEKRISKKTGEETDVRVSGYCSSPKKAIIDMFKRNVYKSDTDAFEGACNAIDRNLNKALKIIEDACLQMEGGKK